MYLSNSQHSKLRNAVMDFEVPYRAYVSTEILKVYPTETDFGNAVNQKYALGLSHPSLKGFDSEFGKIRGNSGKIFELLNNAKTAVGNKIQETEINVPFVSQINALILIFDDLFRGLINRFFDLSTFWEKAEKFHYVRNKLSHPGCKTLEISDMKESAEFMDGLYGFLIAEAPAMFYLETQENIKKQILALDSSDLPIPVEIDNFQEMPFLDTKLVCRDNEVNEIKNFVYGKPGALRKKNSYCLFGYGGVGKTVLVLSAIKSIVQDLVNNVAVNHFSPSFILFFTAKKERLEVAVASGEIEQIEQQNNFHDFESLKSAIFGKLKIADFNGYEKTGLIIIDNFETIAQEERTKIREFIEYGSPQGVQYIITSRNEEPFSERKLLGGFDDSDKCNKFLDTYIEENDLNIELSQEDKDALLDITKGNTLVLVLCIKRLEQKFSNIVGLKADLTRVASIRKMGKELKSLPANGYEIISEYMFKNTFEELEQIFEKDSRAIYAVLKILAVYPNKYVDIYTITLLSKCSYQTVEPIMYLLCNYLIVEKKSAGYCLNEFAEKYITFRFFPDRESYLKMSSEIEQSTREINRELRNLDDQIRNYPNLKKIISEWAIDTQGDKIAAAKIYKLYGEVKEDCEKNTFFVRSAYNESKELFSKIESSTIHPYVKFQKARILNLLNQTGLLDCDLSNEIKQAYQDCIWVLKTNGLYSAIKKTKTYASILMFFAMHLQSMDSDVEEILRNLEESYSVFAELKIRDKEFYQCVLQLAKGYYSQYKKTGSPIYLKKACEFGKKQYENHRQIGNSAKSFMEELNREMKKVKSGA